MGRRPAAFTSFELEAEAEAAEAAAAAVSRKAATVNSGGGLISAAAEKRTLLQSPIVLPIVLVGMDCQDRPGLAPLLRAATRMERGAPPPPLRPLTRLSPPHVCVRLPPSTDPKKASQSAGRKCAINHVEKRGPASFVEVDADAAMDRCDAHSICMRTVQYGTTQYWLAHKKMHATTVSLPSPSAKCVYVETPRVFFGRGAKARSQGLLWAQETAFYT